MSNRTAGADVSTRSFTPLPLGCCGCLCAPDLLAGTGLGECMVAGDGEGGVVVVRADPRVAVSGVLLRDWHDALPGSFSLECRGDPDHIGDLIRVNAAGQRLRDVGTRRGGE